MNNKLRMSLCLQLSIFAHYYVLSSVCAEVQAQSVRTNRETVIQTLNVARRAEIDVGPYFERMAQAPLNPEYDKKIQYGRDIQNGLTKLAEDLQSDLDQSADWQAFHKREDAVLILATGMDGNIDEAAMIARDGQAEICRHFERQGKLQSLRGRGRIDRKEAENLFQSCLYLQEQKAPVKLLSPASHRGSLYTDYHGQTSCDLLAVNDGNSNEHRSREMALSVLKQLLSTKTQGSK